MKATGVIRRIDELGRIVIPKEIRRTLKIKNGTPLEIYSGDNGELLLKKYSPILEICDFAGEVAASIFKATNLSVLVTNMEKVVGCKGATKAFVDRPFDSVFEKALQQRNGKIYTKADLKTLLFADQTANSFAICPVVSEGDVFGSIVLFGADRDVTYDELKLGVAFAEFLGKQIG